MNNKPQQPPAEQDLTASMLAANVYGLLFGLAPALLLLALFWLLWRGRELAPFSINFLWGLLIILAGVVLHELLHGLGWILFGGVPRQSINFGFQWKLLTPYAHSSESMPIRGYLWGAVLPGLLLGILPGLLALATGSLVLLAFSFFFTLAAGGDFFILWLLRNVPPQAHARDHPTKAGAIITL